MAYTITGTYGTGTPCDIYVYKGWYSVAGSVNVNRCDEALLIDGVDVESLPDYDCFTASAEINSADELTTEVDY